MGTARAPGVLLLSPGIVKWDDQDFGLPHLVALGGYLRRETGARVEIVDLAYEGGDRRHLEALLRGLGPWLVIGISTYSSYDHLRASALARWLREVFPGVPLVTGGYHASARPFDCVGEDEAGAPRAFDAVVVGEGERPFAELVTTLLGGGRLEQRVWGPDVVPDLDALPPYAWDLLHRYWPHARSLGRKLQVYLSRGCVYHCDFCMERAKSGYSWRAYAPERAVDELARLATFTDLSGWVVNVADPLFGFHRGWRRAVLEGIAAKGLLPRAYWTLTRSDDLDETDVALLARARFAIGIGLESGSPSMLVRMQKGNRPERYLAAVERLARLADTHGLPWAANVIVGHPGETRDEQRETLDFVTRLFLGAGRTRGWLSVDPFRLYPGSQIAETLDRVEAEHGARFYHPTWWHDWYDAGFRSEHLDASREVDFRSRVRFLHDAYGPLVRRIRDVFVGTGREVDAVWRASMEGQVRAIGPGVRDALLRQADHAVPERTRAAVVRAPIGLQVRDPWARLREGAVRRLLDQGVLRTAALVDALLEVPIERFVPEDVARRLLLGEVVPAEREGALPWGLPVDVVAAGLEALAPPEGGRCWDATARAGWVAAVLAALVGPDGEVLASCPEDADDLARRLGDLPTVRVTPRGLEAAPTLRPFDAIWIGAAVPRRPELPLRPGGRLVAPVGPRFRAQDLAVWSDSGERRLLRVAAPVLGGPWGWVPAVRLTAAPVASVRVEAWPGPAAWFRVLTALDLPGDAADLRDPAVPADPALRAAWDAAPGRLQLHAVGLWSREVAAPASAPGLDDPAGRALLAAVKARLAPAPTADPHRVAAVAAWLPERLAPLRSILWQGRPPPLVVLDAPALGRRGRATVVDGEHRVAVSLGQPDEHVLLQVLHEEMHPVTDPHVELPPGGPERDTRVGSPGFARHAALEDLALRTTEALLQTHAPALLPAFLRWRGALGDGREVSGSTAAAPRPARP